MEVIIFVDLGDSVDPLKAAADAAHQLELQKKLQEGQEPVSISQQENCSIKVIICWILINDPI